MFKKFSAIACAVAVAATLAGCASVLPPDDDSELKYDHSLSRAKNLVFWRAFKSIKDVEAPEGVEFDSDGSVLLHTAGWTANLYSASGSFLPGTSNLGSAFGIGLGLSLVADAFKQPPLTARNVSFGYVPLEQATSSFEARKLYLERLAKVLEDSAKKMYPNAQVKQDFYHIKESMLTADVFTGGIEIIDEKLGCHPFSEDIDKEETCSIWVSHRLPSVPTTGTNPALGPSIQAWRITLGTIESQGGKKQGIDWAKLLVSCTDSLPAYTMIYVTSQEAPDGTRNPPMVLEKGRVNFFVKPKAAQ